MTWEKYLYFCLYKTFESKDKRVKSKDSMRGQASPFRGRLEGAFSSTRTSFTC